MTISATSTTETAAADIKQQAGMLLQQVAGYVGSRTTQLGLRDRLVDTLTNADNGLTVDELAIQADIDPCYAQVWCQCSPESIAGVAATGLPFHARLVAEGLNHAPGGTAWKGEADA